TRARDARAGELTAGSVLTSNVNATSSARTGRPSCQRAAAFRWKVSVRGLSHSHFSASSGTKPASPMVFPDGPRSASLTNTWSNTAAARASSDAGGSRISGSPGAAMTSVPQYSPVQPTRRPHAAAATTATKTPTTTRVRMSGKILPGVYRRQVQSGSAKPSDCLTVGPSDGTSGSHQAAMIAAATSSNVTGRPSSADKLVARVTAPGVRLTSVTRSCEPSRRVEPCCQNVEPQARDGGAVVARGGGLMAAEGEARRGPPVQPQEGAAARVGFVEQRVVHRHVVGAGAALDVEQRLTLRRSRTPPAADTRT